MQQTYRIQRIDLPKASKTNKDSVYWSVSLKGLKDNKTWTTYIDSSMKNFKYWLDILDNMDYPYELDNLSIQDLNKHILDADSKPRIIKGPTTFNQLFD